MTASDWVLSVGLGRPDGGGRRYLTLTDVRGDRPRLAGSGRVVRQNRGLEQFALSHFDNLMSRISNPNPRMRRILRASESPCRHLGSEVEMKLQKLARAAALLTGWSLALSAFAVGDKPLKVIVPAPAGGTTDIAARVVAQQMAVDSGRPVIVENRPGASGTIGVGAMLQAASDGDTILVGPNNLLVESPHVMKVTYDPLKDLVSIARVARTGYVLVSGANYPARNFAELLAHLKARKGKSSFANYGNGTTSHYSGLIFSERAGLDMQNIGYPGSPPALQDLIGGQTDIMFDGLATSMPLVKAGKLRAYATSGPQRSSHFPDLPTMAELGYPEIQFQGQMRFYGSSKMAPEVLARLQAMLRKAAEAPAVQKKLADAALEPDVSTDSAAMLAEDKLAWQRNGAIVARFGIR
jgi:tripartite-type tricarboxylate transporter receptor subunit TctC